MHRQKKLWPTLRLLPGPLRGSVIFEHDPKQREWDWRSKGIADIDCVWISALMLQSPNLREIKFDENQAGDAGAKLLAAALAQCPHITYFNLWYNGLGAEGIAAVNACKRDGLDIYVSMQ